MDQGNEKVVLFLNSPSYERVAYALDLANASAALGREVHIMFGPGAIVRLKKNGGDQVGEETDGWIRERIERGLAKGGITPITESLQNLKELGGEIYACPLAMAVHNLIRDELIEEVTKVCGLVEFLNEEAKGASMILYV